MELTITEYTILGIVWSKGPCTTYVVMRELARSPSTFYRKRTATAYRVVQRLISEGLLEHIGETIGSRRDRPVRVAPKGLAVLKEWLAPPLAPVEVAHAIDLIRLRMYFIGAIQPEERAVFVDEAVGALRMYVATLEAVIDEERKTDPFAALASLGAVYETRARIEWLEAIRPGLLSAGE